MQNKQLLSKIVDEIYQQEGVRCYFCQIIGKRWSFLAGDADVLAAPVKYQLSPTLGVIAEKEIIHLDNYIQDISL